MIGLDCDSSINSLYGMRSDEKANSSLTTEHFRIFWMGGTLGFKMWCTQGREAFGRKKYVARTSSEFPFGQLALKVRIVAVNCNNYCMLWTLNLLQRIRIFVKDPRIITTSANPHHSVMSQLILSNSISHCLDFAYVQCCLSLFQIYPLSTI